MKVVAIIQARMGSTRLPGKVLRKLGNKSVLGQVIQRVQACPLVDEVVVATSTSLADEAVGEESSAYGCSVFRGSEEDVLSRYYGAAVQAGADTIVRVTADCPLFDPTVLFQMLALFRQDPARTPNNALDYMSNTLGERTFPRGLDAEVFTLTALARAHAEAYEAWDREHVTPYIYGHPELFHLKGFRQTKDCSKHRWTLDTEDDWKLIQAIYAALGADGGKFSTQDVLDFLAVRPELVAINSSIEQKAPSS